MEEEKSVLQPAAEEIPDATGESAAGSTASDQSANGQNAAGDAPATKEEFEALISGRYRDLYRARVSAIVKDRLKASKETEKKYEALAPALTALAGKYGVGADDTEGLLRAIGKETA